MRVLDQAITLRPDYADAWYNRAILRGRLKQDREALADLERPRQLGGTVPDDLLRSLGPAAQPAR